MCEKLRIAVVGLGLIGGSFARAIKARTGHTVLGMDAEPHVLQYARAHACIDQAIDASGLSTADLVIVALPARATIDFFREHVEHFHPRSILLDVCGVKGEVVKQVEPVLLARGLSYVLTHPMAGREFSGIEYAKEDLFDRASFIIARTPNTQEAACHIVRNLAEAIGFTSIVYTTPEIHDRTIAFTSQLAHVVSSAYIKSDTMENERGFSAGSFLDLTRVAKLNEHMWTELFLMNREPLLHEIDTILLHLQEYPRQHRRRRRGPAVLHFCATAASKGNEPA